MSQSHAVRVRRAPQHAVPQQRSLQIVAGSEKPITPVTISFDVRECDGPALIAAIDEITNEVGGRLEGSYPFPVEDALTRASIALAQLRRSIYAQFKYADPDYKVRASKPRRER